MRKEIYLLILLIAGLSRSLLICADAIDGHEYVDLGLPSGVLWATCNVGATNAEDYGDYFAWGETKPKEEYSWSTYLTDWGSTMTSDNDCGTEKDPLCNFVFPFNVSISRTKYDAAHVKWGGEWRMPTLDEIKELVNNCTNSKTTLNGIYGVKMTSKKNGNFIFLPAAGYYLDSTLNDIGSGGIYWSATPFANSSLNAYSLYLNGDSWMFKNRCLGQTIRPVCGGNIQSDVVSTNIQDLTFDFTSASQEIAIVTNCEWIVESQSSWVTATKVNDSRLTIGVSRNSSKENRSGNVTIKQKSSGEDRAKINITQRGDESLLMDGFEYVDLGLPSGLMWATCNVGANKPEEHGNYYAWGETAPKVTYSWNTYLTGLGGAMDSQQDCLTEKDPLSNYVSISGTEYDAAHVNWGGSWRMPTYDEKAELARNTTHSWTTHNGVYGVRVTSKTNGNFIFLPAAGYYRGSTLYYSGQVGEYWGEKQNPINFNRGSAGCIYIYSAGIETGLAAERCLGLTIRPVCENKTSSDKILVTNITLSEADITLNINETYQLTPTVLPDNANDKSVSWKSSSTSVATIDSGGKVTAVGVGTATITATANDGSGISVSCKVTVAVPTCVTPTFSQSGDKLTLSCTTSGATIYYTMDGTTPTTSSTKYTTPITLTHNCTVKAIAAKENMNNSTVASYDVNTFKAATPSFSQTGDKLTISCTTPGATIYYTIGGATPTNTSTKYTGPITLTDNRIIKAIAYATNFNASAVAGYTPNSSACQQVTISVSGSTATLSCSTSGATIYYTLDGTTPTTSSTKYTAPITLTHNCTIKAIAAKENMNNSTVSSYDVNTFTVATPTFYQIGGKLTISCATSGAAIYYTLDGTTPTTSSTKYTAQVTLTHNCTIKAIAVKENMNNSAVAICEVKSFTAATPTFSQSGGKLTISCATSGATIYYTLDGTTPTTSSSKYTAPITLTHNCTIKAIAVKIYMNNSTVASYDVNTFKAATPVFSQTGDKLTISCTTPGATIYYTIGGAIPTNASTKYTGPITLTDNRIIKAIAYATNFNASAVAGYTPNSSACQQVSIFVSGSTATLSCATSGATIYYTLDGTTPTISSAKYTAPITLTHNCTIKAIAAKENMNSSAVSSYDVNTFKAATPTFSQTGDKLTISCTTPGATIYYTIGGAMPTNASTKYTGPITLTDNRIIKAIAYATNFNVSAVAGYTPNSSACQQVSISVSGSTATLSCATSGATIYYTLDGTTPTTSSTKYTAPITLTHNCTIKAIAAKENMNNSTVASYDVNTFTAATPAFSQTGDKLTISCTTPGATIYYTIGGANPTKASTMYTGPITLTDNRVVKAIVYATNFNVSAVASYEHSFFICEDVEISYDGRYVTLATATQDASIRYTTDGSEPTNASTVYDKPFDAKGMIMVKAVAMKENWDNSNSTSTKLSCYSDGCTVWVAEADALPKALKACGTSNITSIVWLPNEKISEEALTGINNPNLLLYVKMHSFAPSSVHNIVVSGQANDIVLQDGAGFFCPQEFTARNICYTHRYTMPTLLDGRTAGWETIALPFDVQSIVHESNGAIAPFAAADPSAKPFWLGRMTENGFKRAANIKANTPYIICMPNNEEYADDYILAGDVVFSSQNVVVPVTEPQIESYRELQFVPTTIGVDKGKDIFTINRDGDVPGSMFINEKFAVNPFEAYITIGNEPNAARAFSISSLMDNITDDIPVVAASHDDGDGRVYSLSGAMVGTDNQTKRIAKGVYITGKIRVMVK